MLVQAYRRAKVYAFPLTRWMPHRSQGSTISEAVAWAGQEGNLPADMRTLVLQAVEEKDKPFAEVVKHFGPACSMPGAFQNALVAALTCGSYVDGVRCNIMAGGDNCSRSVFLGAMLAAEQGMDSIPAEWRAKTKKYPEFEALTDKLIG